MRLVWTEHINYAKKIRCAFGLLRGPAAGLRQA